MRELVNRGIYLANLGENPGQAYPQLVVAHHVLGSREQSQRPLSRTALCSRIAILKLLWASLRSSGLIVAYIGNLSTDISAHCKQAEHWLPNGVA
jgi:hypothetical protein